MENKWKLTNAQIYTLRRMNSGTVYKMQGDGRRGDEMRFDMQLRCNIPVSCPSLAPLLRHGLIEFVQRGAKTPSLMYMMQLTELGREAAKFLVVKE